MRSNKTLSYFTAHIRKYPHLSVKEKEILIFRLKKRTLVNIGEKFGVTEARIRQIERIAIRKIKSKMIQLALFKRSGS